MRQPLSVVNQAGNSGLDGLVDIKAARGNPHKLLISLSSIFTAPLGAGRWAPTSTGATSRRCN